MKNFLKNRTALGIVCIILAILLSFGTTPLLNNVMKAQVTIVRATADIQEGQMITPEMVQETKVGEFNLPAGVIKDQDSVIGKYAATTIVKDDYFLGGKITDLESKDNSYLYNAHNRRESLSVSITVKSLAAGLSGKLQEGDVVSIISANNNEEEPKVVPELQFVKVLAVTGKEGADIDDKSEGLASTVTLACDKVQAEKLVDHEQNGDIHIALVYRGTEDIAKVYLDQQAEYNLTLMEAVQQEVIKVDEED